MKKTYSIFYFTIFFCILIFGLLSAKDYRSYFPLQVGNNWQYRYEETKTIYALPDSVFGVESFAPRRYYRWGDNKEFPFYIHQDEQGRIFRRINGKDVLWFDFTKNHGEQYTYSPDDDINFTVTVRKNQIVTTYAGQYKNCIEFFFDVPESFDEEQCYVFAPEVGIVKKQFAWVSMLLVSAQIDRKYIARLKETKTNIVSGFTLAQNYPNPFNATTFIKFALPRETSVMLDIYDVRGGKVRSLVATRQLPGEYSVMWDGTDDAGSAVPSGIYTYRLRTDAFIDVKRMVLLR